MPVLLILAFVLTQVPTAKADSPTAPDYAASVAPVLKKYCAGCHNDEDREGKFSLESYAALQRGTAHGPAVLPGDAKGSRMIRLLTGAAKPLMPPKDEPRPGPQEVALLEAWIDAGARGPKGEEPDRLKLVVPKIPAHATVRPVTAMDATQDGQWLAVARGNEVSLFGKGVSPHNRPHALSGPFQAR